MPGLAICLVFMARFSRREVQLHGPKGLLEGQDVPDVDRDEVDSEKIDAAFGIGPAAGPGEVAGEGAAAMEGGGLCLHAQEAAIHVNADVIGGRIAVWLEDSESHLARPRHEAEFSPLALFFAGAEGEFTRTSADLVPAMPGLPRMFRQPQRKYLLQILARALVSLQLSLDLVDSNEFVVDRIQTTKAAKAARKLL
jgi:hypothetical protein